MAQDDTQENVGEETFADGLAGDEALAPSTPATSPAPMASAPVSSAPQQAAAQPVGPGRHLLTGLVGVLIDGLQAGMQAPMNAQGPSQAAAMGTQMPAQRQQQQITLASQQLQLKAKLAQSRIQDLQTKLLASKVSDELADGLTEAGRTLFTKALEQGTAKMVSGTTEDAATANAKLKELHDADPKNSGNYFVAPGVQKGTWGVWEIFPKNSLESDMDISLPGSGSVAEENVHIPAGTDMGTAKVLMSQKLRDHTAKLHDETLKQIQAAKSQTALDVAGIKAKAGAAGAPAKEESRSDKSYQYNQSRLDKIRTPIDGLAARFSRLQDSLNQNTPQADALIAPELLTVMAGGQGSGLRMNEAEISRIVGGRSKWESLKASANKWRLDPRTALSITPEQRNEIRALVTEVGKKINAKQAILSKAGDDLVRETIPEKHRQIIADTQKQLDSIDTGKFPDRETATAVRNAQQPIFAKNPKTGARVQSTDGGKTWQAVP